MCGLGIGWWLDTVDGQRVKDDGLLEQFEMSLEEAQELVMTARIVLGWVDPDELNSSDDDLEDEHSED